MLRWLWSPLWSFGWYALLLSGWVCWFRAQATVPRRRPALTRMAYTLRSTDTSRR